MATIHIEAHKTKDDLSEFVSHGIARWLQLQGASDDLKRYIQSEIEIRAKGMFLWAKLMLGILQWQTTEDDIRESIRAAPDAIDDMVTQMLKVYSSMLKGREAEEFNTILAWLSCATRPLTLAEVDAALRRLSPSGGRVLALEQRFRETYSTLINLVRDDGISTSSLESSPSLTSSKAIPESTIVTFAHASIADYFKRGLGKFAKRKTAAPIGLVKVEAEYTILKTCLEIFVQPGNGPWLEASRALQSYAKTSWLSHTQSLVSQLGSTHSSVGLEHQQLIQAIHDFLNHQKVIQRWCHELAWEYFTEVNAVAIARFVEAYSQNTIHKFPSCLVDWIMAINKRPVTVFYVVAKVNLSESFHRDWFPLESLRIVAQVRALCEGDDTLDCLPDPNKLPESIISKCVEWIFLEPNASWHRNLAICYRRSGHIVSAIEHFERALELDPELIEARVGLALAYKAQGYYTKVIDLESANAVILKKRLQVANHEDLDDIASRQKLSISYEAIANSYRLMKDETSALKYWRKAMETGSIRDKTIRR
jgi:tetratricopeptide (TPR) repeat protein